MDLKFREYYQDNQQQQRQYPRPLPAALAGGYLGYAFGGPVGGLAGAAAGYGVGKLLGPKKTHEENPQNWIYYRKADGTVDRYLPPEENLTPEEANAKNADPNHPYFYKPLANGKFRGVLKKHIRSQSLKPNLKQN